MTKCYVLASMLNVIQHQLQDVNHAAYMMTILKEMFGEQSHATKLDTMITFLNTKMAKGTLVREHCLAMIVMLNTLEVLGVEIDGESQVDVILHSLPNSFNQLRLNMLMNKNESTLAKLMNELIAAEDILMSKVIVNYASRSGPKGLKKHKQLKPVGKPIVKRLKKVGDKCQILLLRENYGFHVRKANARKSHLGVKDRAQ
ncbi:uncharacterized protein LOC132187893 [Corylus avellana]|uniref:uncharacterized protein LOC132187893 n=1 Tax=Corylus avellana TaxID=13451 RepID=UPI00286A0301|nr:uncharacterized protein LOC132187893 [Corylus avellana]